ncbi:MAG: tetratricopeptide repeat protein [Myxococcales bacterium]|nr:tetratricopeptide repeat protein [Myxococcales bacterium]
MRVIRYIILICLSLSVVAASCGRPHVGADDARKAKGYYELAVASMNGGDATGALNELLKAVEINPYDPDIHNALGLVYYSNEKYTKAISHFQKAIELDPQHSDAHHNLGHLYLTQGRYDLATAEFQQALENDLYRNRAQTLNALGYTYYKKRDYLKAEETLKGCIEHDRLYFLAYDNLAKVYIALERYDDARPILEQALQMQPLFPEAMLDLGLVYWKINKKNQAVDLFKRVKQIDPLGEFGARADEYLGLLE